MNFDTYEHHLELYLTTNFGPLETHLNRLRSLNATYDTLRPNSSGFEAKRDELELEWRGVIPKLAKFREMLDRCEKARQPIVEMRLVDTMERGAADHYQSDYKRLYKDVRTHTESLTDKFRLSLKQYVELEAAMAKKFPTVADLDGQIQAHSKRHDVSYSTAYAAVTKDAPVLDAKPLEDRGIDADQQTRQGEMIEKVMQERNCSYREAYGLVMKSEKADPNNRTF